MRRSGSPRSVLNRSPSAVVGRGRLDLDVSGEQFSTNTVVMRYEGRYGFEVLRPQAVAIGRPHGGLTGGQIGRPGTLDPSPRARAPPTR